ncbi:hypothetical protein ACFVAV_25270 [Nocardia sp. NPDC057663]|uniref:hypothetical protein n=1 Tax=Nocardia sp. NPDC057663 TaxID=3346201 RepID=UPI0036726F0F
MNETREVGRAQTVLSAVPMGILAGAGAGIGALVRWPGVDHPQPYQGAVVLAAFVAMAGWFALRTRRLASFDSSQITVTSALASSLSAAAVFGAMVFVTNSAQTSVVIVLGIVAVVTAILLPRSARAQLVCYALLAVLGVHAWSGTRWGIPLLVSAGVVATVLALTAIVLSSSSSTTGRSIEGAVIFGAVTAVVLPVSALAAEPYSFVSREWQQSAVAASLSRLAVGIPPSESGIVFGTVAAAVSTGGAVAVLDFAAPGKHVLWLREPAGEWTRSNLSARFQRPDGASILLAADVAGGQNTALRASLTGAEEDSSTEAFAGVGEKPSLAYSGDDLFGVSNRGLWRVEDGKLVMVANPWDKQAVRRTLAANDGRDAIVLSDYAADGAAPYYSTMETISLETGKVERIDFDQEIPATVSERMVPSTKDVRDGQWPMVGVSSLNDGTFVTLVGEAIVRFTPQGERRTVMRFKQPDKPFKDLKLVGDLMSWDIDGPPHMARFNYGKNIMSLVPDGEPRTAPITRSSENVSRRCGSAGATLTPLWTGYAEVATGTPGSQAVVVTVGDGCSVGVWRNEPGKQDWLLLNSTRDFYTDNPPLTVEGAGLTHNPSTVEGKLLVNSASLRSEFVVWQGTPQLMSRNPSGEAAATTYQRIVGSARSGQTRWLLAHAKGTDWSDADGTASLFRVRADGDWERTVSFEGATGLAVTANGTVVVSTCVAIYAADSDAIARATESGTSLNEQFRTVANLPNRWDRDKGCIPGAAPSEDNPGGRVSFAHAISPDAKHQAAVLVSQSVLLPDNRWRHLISRLDTGTGAVSPVPGADFTDDGLVPVAMASRDDGAMCVAALDEGGRGVLLYNSAGISRRVRLDSGVQPNGCTWTADGIVVTDSITGDVYLVRSAGRRGF